MIPRKAEKQRIELIEPIQQYTIHSVIYQTFKRTFNGSLSLIPSLNHLYVTPLSIFFFFFLFFRNVLAYATSVRWIRGINQ